MTWLRRKDKPAQQLPDAQVSGTGRAVDGTLVEVYFTSWADDSNRPDEMPTMVSVMRPVQLLYREGDRIALRIDEVHDRATNYTAPGWVAGIVIGVVHIHDPQAEWPHVIRVLVQGIYAGFVEPSFHEMFEEV